MRLVPLDVLLVREPGYGFPEPPQEAFFPAVEGFPSGQYSCFFVIRPEPLDFALFGTQADLIGLDLNCCTHDLGDHADRFADGHFEIAADVDDLADRTVRFAQQR